MPRITLDPDVYVALKAESLVRRSSLKETLANMVLDNLSPKAQSILNALDIKKVLLPHKASARAADSDEEMHPCKKKTRQPLARNQEAITIVNEMLKQYPTVTYAEIGKAVGYSRHVIGDYHKKLGEEK